MANKRGELKQKRQRKYIMQQVIKIVSIASLLVLIIVFINNNTVTACSTFKLQKGGELIYGHNLNQGDIGVPGMIYINKRGILKKGRTWSELLDKDQSNPSNLFWMSKYGSVTINVFAKDFPDGGMNEAGLYIWEMNESADCPKNDSLPKLNKMNWMQFVLDNYSTVDEAVQSASEIEIEASSWHYFVGDAQGNCAVIAFIDGEVVVNQDHSMPVPGLFNTPYNRELEILRYYKGFGGSYDPDLNDPEVPRFVKTAAMIRDYNPVQDAVEYGFEILEKITVYDIPEWSVIIDARRGDVYFKTRINPAVKHFSMYDIDFSNNTNCMILDLDKAESSWISSRTNVLDQFHPYTNEEMRAFVESFVVPILPEEFFTSGGLTVDEYLDRFSFHSDTAIFDNFQFFKGIWKATTANENDGQIIKINLDAIGNAVQGRIFISNGAENGYEMDHLEFTDNQFNCTYRLKHKGWEKTLIEVKGVIANGTMNINMYDIEVPLGRYSLIREE